MFRYAQSHPEFFAVLALLSRLDPQLVRDRATDLLISLLYSVAVALHAQGTERTVIQIGDNTPRLLDRVLLVISTANLLPSSLRSVPLGLPHLPASDAAHVVLLLARSLFLPHIASDTAAVRSLLRPLYSHPGGLYALIVQTLK